MFTEEMRGAVLILRILEKRLDARLAPEFRAELLARIENGRTLIVVDLSETVFVDSSGLGALISGLKLMGPTGGLAVSGAKGAVARLFELTRMNRVISMHDTSDDAVARLMA